MCIYNIESSKNKKKTLNERLCSKFWLLDCAFLWEYPWNTDKKIIKSTYVDNHCRSNTQTITCFFYSLPLCGRHTAVALHNQCDLQSIQRNSKNKHHTCLTIFLLYNTRITISVWRTSSQVSDWSKNLHFVFNHILCNFLLSLTYKRTLWSLVV